MIFSGLHYKTGEGIKIEVKRADIVSIKTEVANFEYFIAPGLVDLQVNGYKGIDFNSEQLTPNLVKKVTHLLLQEGVTSFYPTIVTTSLKKMKKLCSVIARAVEHDSLVRECIKGIHLEGPFISIEDGPRGAHDKEFIRQPNWQQIEEVQKESNGLVKMITLAPEWSEAPDFIRKAVEKKIKIGIGHTAANSEQIEAAVNAGAILSTHLGNGAHPMLNRHPNYIWDQLAEKRLYASVIADGFHLPENVLRVIDVVKQEKMVLISDSVALAGEAPGQYETTVGGKVYLTKEGRLHLVENEALLAGSAYNLRQCVEKLHQQKITTLATAIDRASINPAELMDMHLHYGLIKGAVADFFLFQKDHLGRIAIVHTVKNGEIVYSSSEEKEVDA